jgi:hypothetical protein
MKSPESTLTRPECPEGTAKYLLASGWLHKDERVVLFNTDLGLKDLQLQ